jgi:hypothetical protein
MSLHSGSLIVAAGKLGLIGHVARVMQILRE